MGQQNLSHSGSEKRYARHLLPSARRWFQQGKQALTEGSPHGKHPQMSHRARGSRRRVALVLFVSIIATIVDAGQPASALFRDDFPISADVQDLREHWPKVVFDSAGNFLVAWFDKLPYDPAVPNANWGLTYGRLFWADGTPRGSSFPLMPDSMRAFSPPIILMYPDGRFWSIDSDRHLRRTVGTAHSYASKFTAEGSRLLGPECLTCDFAIDSIIMDPNGAGLGKDERFAVGFEEKKHGGLHLCQFDSLGIRLGAIQRIDSSEEFPELGDLDHPIPSYLPGQGLVVTFDANIFPGTNPMYSGAHTFRRYYDTLTLPTTDALVCFCGDSIEEGCGFYTQCPLTGISARATAASGDFALAVAMAPCYSASFDIYVQGFTVGGDSLGTPQIVSDSTTDSYAAFLDPKIGGGPNGTYVVIWIDGRNRQEWDGPADLYAQMVDSTGHTIGGNIVINSLPQSPYYTINDYDVAIHDSQVVIVWADYRNAFENPSRDYDVYCQMMELRDFVWFMPGDCNGSRDVTTSDVIWLVNYVFKSGAWPQPRVESGDANGDCKISAVDIITMVNYVFKSGAPPVNAGCLTGP